MAHHPRRQPQAQGQQEGAFQGVGPERGGHLAVGQVGEAVREPGHGPEHRDQPAVGAEDQQARRGQRRGPGPRPEDQHQRGRGHGQVKEGHVEPGDLAAEPAVGPEQLQAQCHDRDQQQPVGDGDPAATAVEPPGGQRPDQPRVRRVPPQQQPQADHEQDAGLGQHRPEAPGSGPRVDEQVLDPAGVPVAVRPGQHDPEDGQPEHAEGHQPGRQLRGEDDGQGRDAELGRDEPVRPAGHHGGRHRDGQQQQTQAAGLDAPRRPSWPGTPCFSRASTSPDRQHQHNRDKHDRRLLSTRPAPILAVAAGDGQGPATPNRGGAGPTMAGRGGGAEGRAVRRGLSVGGG